MRLNVYGKRVEVIKRKDSYLVYYLGPEGKKRPAEDISIPKEFNAHQIIQYLEDLCHEWATPENRSVERLK